MMVRDSRLSLRLLFSTRYEPLASSLIRGVMSGYDYEIIFEFGLGTRRRHRETDNKLRCGRLNKKCLRWRNYQIDWTFHASRYPRVSFSRKIYPRVSLLLKTEKLIKFWLQTDKQKKHIVDLPKTKFGIFL